jgi:hypothetical protein
MELLNTPFNHSKWFRQLNKETQKYEPYTTKKEALQYFVSSGDFYNDNGVLRFSGKEKGSYKMSQKESDYFTQLLKQKDEAKQEAKKHIEILKILASEENKKIDKNFIFKNCIVCVTIYFGSEYVHTGISFIDYIKAHGGETKELLKTLYEEAKTPFKETDEKEEINNLINMFLDWKNNFLTVGKFAEYYNLTIDKANSLIDKGRELNEKRAIEKQNFVIN